MSVEPEIAVGRRAFPKAQELFEAAAPGVRSQVEGLIDVGWHDTARDRERGAFAVVREGAGRSELIGEIVRVGTGTHSVLVYVLGERDVPSEVSLARRAFFALAPLSRESVACVVEVMG